MRKMLQPFLVEGQKLPCMQDITLIFVMLDHFPISKGISDMMKTAFVKEKWLYHSNGIHNGNQFTTKLCCGWAKVNRNVVVVSQMILFTDISHLVGKIYFWPKWSIFVPLLTPAVSFTIFKRISLYQQVEAKNFLLRFFAMTKS